MKPVLLLALLVVLAPSIKGQQVDLSCAPSQAHIKALQKKHPIDADCESFGKGGSDGLAAQNRAENNFCTTNRPVEVTVAELKALNALTEERLTNNHIPFGSSLSLPRDRTWLDRDFTVGNKTLSEGMAVFIRAFVLNAHHSSASNDENVNCNKKGRVNKNIRISLGLAPGSDPCFGTNAVISPHFRPDSWEEFDDYIFTHPVLIVGQLFYDASHRPCTAQHRSQPERSSSWEIHPVYSIYVCKNSVPQQCPARTPNDLATKWTVFDQWVNQSNDESRSATKSGLAENTTLQTVTAAPLNSKPCRFRSVFARDAEAGSFGEGTSNPRRV